MLEISENEIAERLSDDNPWWCSKGGVDDLYMEMPERAYFQPFFELFAESRVNRAIILLGPRRVGKTVMLHQSVARLLADGVEGRRILYISIDTPTYTGMSLERLLQIFIKQQKPSKKERCYVIFDEIQYLKDWEVHLKSLVDTYTNWRFVASGSAAAALKMKSQESGAGRFTEFMLPPLTFPEYLSFIGEEDNLIAQKDRSYKNPYASMDQEALNAAFINYLNYGGYPEAVFSEEIRRNPSRYIRSDIVDKVLLRDLPSLYGISNIQELNRLFTFVAYNTGNEMSLDSLAKHSGVAKNTIRRYMEYLEAAFLIVRVKRVDQNAARFKRDVAFKVYLTNPAMRAALFHPVSDDDDAMGALAETAIFSQWFHSEFMDRLFYARWNKGEIDLVYLPRDFSGADWCVEIKWSDRIVEHIGELSHLVDFANKNEVSDITVTTRGIEAERTSRNVAIRFIPTSLYCYAVGKNVFLNRGV